MLDPLPFALDSNPNPIKGQLLSVTLSDHHHSLLVCFSTHPSSSALQWLSPPQTFGKRLPYAYTHPRLLHLPCNDTPTARIRFSTLLNLLGHMSAATVEQRERVPTTSGGVQTTESLKSSGWTSARPGPGRLVEEGPDDERAGGGLVIRPTLHVPVPNYSQFFGQILKEIWCLACEIIGPILENCKQNRKSHHEINWDFLLPPPKIKGGRIQ